MYVCEVQIKLLILQKKKKKIKLLIAVQKTLVPEKIK